MATGVRAAVIQVDHVRASVLGLGREGLALTRFLCERGATVTVSDRKTEGELALALKSLEGLPATYLLGGHPLELLDCDVLFASPGVPLDSAIIAEARRRGVQMSSESRLFGRLCPATIVGVTGSSGKTTTVTLIGEMLKGASRRVHVGGNIGQPLLLRLPTIAAGDMVVMELSSFQLSFWGPDLDAEPHQELRTPLYPAGGFSPAIGVVLNITPNHLDRHPTMDDYVAAKAKILEYQKPEDHAILNLDDQMAASLSALTPARVSYFSLHKAVAEGAFLKGDELVLCHDGKESLICAVDDVRLKGRHNIANLLAACATASLLGVEVEEMAAVATTFGGVEHRLEAVRAVDGVWYFNDSIATTPERAVAALRSFTEPVVLLAGGRDKHLPWTEWAQVVSERAAGVVLFGEAGPMIESVLVGMGAKTPPHWRTGGLADAVAKARDVAKPGQVVLFSPGGTSFDAFRDFVERGETFKLLVHELV